MKTKNKKNNLLTVMILCIVLIIIAFSIISCNYPPFDNLPGYDFLREREGVRFRSEPGLYRDEFVLYLDVSEETVSEYYKLNKSPGLKEMSADTLLNDGKIVVYYTKNGDIPAVGSAQSIKYEGSKGVNMYNVNMSSTDRAGVNVIRAAAFDIESGEMIGREVSGTFIVDENYDERYSDDVYADESDVVYDDSEFDDPNEEPVKPSKGFFGLFKSNKNKKKKKKESARKYDSDDDDVMDIFDDLDDE